jgi:hypothetical protein
LRRGAIVEALTARFIALLEADAIVGHAASTR